MRGLVRLASTFLGENDGTKIAFKKNSFVLPEWRCYERITQICLNLLLKEINYILQTSMAERSWAPD